MLNNNELEIIEASAFEVEIKVGNVHLRFRSNGKNMGIVSKFDPLREIYDANALWVPKKYFRKACQQAAKIMSDKQLLAARRALSAPKN